MRPWIWPGGFVHIVTCRIEQLHVGEIAVFFDGRALYSHRVLSTANEGFATKGDWALPLDSMAQPSQLLGRAVRFSGRFGSYRLDSRWGLAIGRFIAESPRLRSGLSQFYRALLRR